VGGFLVPGSVLRGMAWEHDRSLLPLAAATRAWRAAHPGADIAWAARPLKAFEDQPLEQLAADYDLILIDHPLCGAAAGSGLVAAVDDWADAAYLADQRANSVGPSFASYSWDGRQWALAIDAACQVSAVREDLWDAAALGPVPDGWEAAAELVAGHGARGRVAIPLNPTHAYCAFLAVGCALAGGRFWPPGGDLDPDAAAAALALLRRLAPGLHPRSPAMDPIAASELMAGGDEVAYVPLLFGYSNYARAGYRRARLRFGNAPRGPAGTRGSVLGGVGIAVSARSRDLALAADFARFVASPQVQATTYVNAGGQPGHAAAWSSPAADEQVGGFFSGTIATMRGAFTRPRSAGHRRFQQLAGELVHSFLWADRLGVRECVERLRGLAATLLGGGRGS
jgi:multiple sugar transport system substrate-binding protein